MPSKKTRNSDAPLAIIGGSGLARLAVLDGARRQALATPFGKPSCALIAGTIAGRKIVFLQRHGEGHTIPPHEINYRANIWALHASKAKDVVAIFTVGGIRADLGPGVLAVPDQIIDYTHGRRSTIVTRSRSRSRRGVTHVDFTHPYCEAMRQRLLDAARAAGEDVVAGGTYGATQGPRLESAAEINRLERDGADMVGMTGMPEAGLAREVGLCYAAIAVVVNHAAGRGSSKREISHADIEATSSNAMKRVHRILDQLAKLHGG